VFKPATTYLDYSQALCAQTDPEIFFPEKGGSTIDARKICVECPVRNDCLLEALANDYADGIWGGLSPKERQALKRGGELPTSVVEVRFPRRGGPMKRRSRKEVTNVHKRSSK
jgi:hypothetical protein